MPDAIQNEEFPQTGLILRQRQEVVKTKVSQNEPELTPKFSRTNQS